MGVGFETERNGTERNANFDCSVSSVGIPWRSVESLKFQYPTFLCLNCPNQILVNMFRLTERNGTHFNGVPFREIYGTERNETWAFHPMEQNGTKIRGNRSVVILL